MTQPKAPELVAFDLETTGLSPRRDAILEVGAVKFDLEGRCLGEFQRLARPDGPLAPKIVEITGITDAMVKDSPPPTAVAIEFLAWAGPESVFVAHNASFDHRFLVATLMRVNAFIPALPIVDTLGWSRTLRLPVENHRLATLLAHFGIPAEGMHRSLADARGVRSLVLRLLEGAPDPRLEILRRIELPNPPRPRSSSTWPEY